MFKINNSAVLESKGMCVWTMLLKGKKIIEEKILKKEWNTSKDLLTFPLDRWPWIFIFCYSYVFQDLYNHITMLEIIKEGEPPYCFLWQNRISNSISETSRIMRIKQQKTKKIKKTPFFNDFFPLKIFT